MVGEGLLYLDPSALVKLVRAEAESDALAAYLAASRAGQLTSVISEVEVPRAAARAPNVDSSRVESVLEQVNAILLDAVVLRRAARLDPPSLRSLDAIHLASAIGIGVELAAFVTYDVRLAAAARAEGLTVVSPA